MRFGPDNKGWVTFRYERFPIFCYWCGRLTHDDGDCDIWIRSKGTLGIEDQPFRDWMRAPLLSMSRRKMILVPGQERQRMIAPRGNETPSTHHVNQVDVGGGLPTEDQTESRVEEIMRMESKDFQDIIESVEIMANKEILRVN